jgi:phosphopantetheine--protein transferase-like protein
VIGFGLDVEPIARWEQLVVDEVAWARMSRTFTPVERAELEAHPAGPARAAAGRWVAKEAVVKAIPGAVGMRDVEVVRAAGEGLAVTAPMLCGMTVHVAVSHTADHVFAAAWVGAAASEAT